MSDWTDNPFAQKNDDPFSDPSVTQAKSNVPEYNPFEHSAQPVKSNTSGGSGDLAGVGAFAQQNATTTPSDDVTAANTTPSWASEEPVKTQVVVEQKKETIITVDQQRESEYDRRERQANKVPEVPPGRPANFPNFPDFMRKGPLQPCFYLNFAAEIPDRGLRTTKQVFLLWKIYCLVLFWNMICMLTALACGDCGGIESALLSVAYFVFFVPCSYSCWFHSLYTGMRKDASLRFGWFFFTFGFQFLFCAFFALGPPKCGAAGFWTAIKVVDDDKIAGIIVFTSAALWFILTLVNLYLIRKVLQYYRSTGQSVEKMQREAVVGVASNKTVRKVAIDAATSQA